MFATRKLGRFPRTPLALLGLGPEPALTFLILAPDCGARCGAGPARRPSRFRVPGGLGRLAEMRTIGLVSAGLLVGAIAIMRPSVPTVTSTSSTPWAFSSATTFGTRVMWAPERIESPTASASSWIAVSTICSGVWCRPV